MLAVNLDAVFFCPVFQARDGAPGTARSSTPLRFSRFRGITVPAYAASKHAVAGLTKALCNEWAGHGVNVNAIAPGYMDTDLNVDFSEPTPPAAGRW